MVAAGVGVALVPALTVDASDPAVRVLELGAQLPPRLVGLGWHRDRYRSAAARAFVEAAQLLCEEIASRRGTSTSGSVPRGNVRDAVSAHSSSRQT